MDPGQIFRWRWSGWAESSAGYRLRWRGRAGLDYVDENGPLSVDSEMLASPGQWVFVKSVPADRSSVLGRLTQLLLWGGDDVHFHPSPQSW